MYEDAPKIDVYERRTQKANKQHICSLCKNIINIHEIYTRTFMIEDNKPVIWKEHALFSCPKC